MLSRSCELAMIMDCLAIVAINIGVAWACGQLAKEEMSC